MSPPATPVSHPDSYIAYAFTEVNGKLNKITLPWKEPEIGQVVVKVLACGVCGSDEGVQTQLFPGGLPRVPGHEIIGDIVSVHSSEKHWKVGQRVGGGWHGGHCTSCDSCRVGDFCICRNQAINGVTIDGGYAEYTTLRSEAVVSVPEEIDPAEAAPMLCAGITTFNSLRHMDVRSGEIVAVQGIGGLGHFALQFARAMGFHTVALSSSPSKKALAEQLGAHTYIDGSKVDQAKALQELGGAKVIMCTAPNPQVIQNLVSGLAVGGQLLLLALPSEPIHVNVVEMCISRLSIRGWPSGHAKDSEETIAFARQAGIHTKVERFPLEKAQAAYDHRAKARFRAVLIPGLQDS
ncbi:GroES-like protein [Abortiporus biennis]|nr:GroES-like protein [Abortiporus biennis]